LKLLIYEHASAAGFQAESVNPSILCEGFGMLRTIVEDAKNAGHDVTTILHHQILELHPPLEAHHEIAVDSPSEAENAIKEATDILDAAYVLAPETSGVLKELVEKIERSNTESLNSTGSAIAKVSDKLFLQQHARKIGLSTPATLEFDVKEGAEKVARTVAEEIGFPSIFKPVDGVGCEAMSMVNDEKQVRMAIAQLSKRAVNHFMVQQPILGTSASVSLISNGTQAMPIALNEQRITLGTPGQGSSYKGGTTPLNHRLKSAAFATARKLVESVPGLKGYVGVDLVLTENEPVVIEVNPRLTTSYVGIRKTVEANLAQTIVDATVRRALPRKEKTKGYAYFEKVETPSPQNRVLQETFCVPEVVSPPFPTPNEMTSALVCTHASTPQAAKKDFSNAEKHLRAMLLSGGRSERRTL